MPSKDPFYGSYAWQQQRKRVFQRDNYRCTHPGCRRIGKQAGGRTRLICDHYGPRRLRTYWPRVSLRQWTARGRRPELYPDAWCRTLCEQHSGKADGARRYT